MSPRLHPPAPTATPSRPISAGVRGSPYVGVTGVVSLDDLTDTLRAFSAAGWHGWPVGDGGGGRRPMVGVLVSGRTMAGEAVPNRRYPSRDLLGALVHVASQAAFTTVHFNTRDPRPLDEQLGAVVAAAPAVHGLQLNLVRPDPLALRRFRDGHPHVESILQVSRRCPASVEPAAVVEYIATYAGLCEHALLDLSGGTGRALDPAWVAACVAAGEADGLWQTIAPGVAGGLGPEAGDALCAVRALRAAGAPLSLDAEGRLRRPVADPLPNEPFQDALDRVMVVEYLRLVQRWG